MIKSAEFIVSNTKIEHCPKDLIPEYAFIGRSNVGKSSLFNALLGEKVAIVSEQPGTTRDVVRKSLFLSGVEVRFEDTAGIRDVKDSEIESEGIEMAKAAAENADLLVEVFDDPEKISKKDTSSLVVLKFFRQETQLKNVRKFFFHYNVYRLDQVQKRMKNFQ